MLFNSLISQLTTCVEYLVSGHVADRAVSLHALQLIETPVEFVQNFNRQIFRGIVCERTKIRLLKATRTRMPLSPYTRTIKRTRMTL